MENKSIAINVYNQCNSNCVMCTNLVKYHRKIEKPSLQKLYDRIDNEKLLSQVTITGGEPTLSNDLFTFIRYINNNKPNAHILLLTNGRRFCYPSYTKNFKKQDFTNIEIAIPIHGFNSNSHDSITCGEGSFKQTVIGIKNLIEQRVVVEIRVIIHGFSYKNLPLIAQYIKKNLLGVSRVVFIFMEIVGNAMKNKKKILIKFTSTTKYLSDAIKLLNNIETRLYHFPLCILSLDLWPYVWRSLEQKKIMFLDSCVKCNYKKNCLGIMRTYAAQVGTNEFKPINEEYNMNETGSYFHPFQS